MIDILKSGRLNHRLLCELVAHKGFAKEIHHSTHSTPNIHINPHGHEITYDEMTGYPSWSDAINGIGSDFLKKYTGGKSMSSIIYDMNTPEDNQFKTISEFKWSMKHGAEVLFKWNGVEYGAFGKIRRGNSDHLQVVICQTGSAEVNKCTKQYYDTPDEALEYMVGSDRLRDVITQVTVLDRTI